MKCKAAHAATSPIDLGGFTNNDVLVIDSGSQLSSSVMNMIRRADIAADKWDSKPD